MSDTTIPWATKSWNPVVGCTPVSAGCDHCYGKRIYERFHPGRSFAEVHTIEARLEEPLHWRKPQRVFVCSMSDLFNHAVPLDVINHVWQTMLLAKQHTFIVLTKRPERMLRTLNLFGLVLPNVWLGVTAENQEMADERIPLLLKTPAAVRFVSIEPALGRVDLTAIMESGIEIMGRRATSIDATTGFYIHVPSRAEELGWWGNKLSWVVLGCESGPGRRPMNIMWARSVRDQCQAAGIPFFFKQGQSGGRVVSMPYLDGRQWAEYPEASDGKEV
jgi:protein gp37